MVHYNSLERVLTCLEKQGMTLARSISIVEDAKIKLTQNRWSAWKNGKNENRNCIGEK